MERRLLAFAFGALALAVVAVSLLSWGSALREAMDAEGGRACLLAGGALILAGLAVILVAVRHVRGPRLAGNLATLGGLLGLVGVFTCL